MAKPFRSALTGLTMRQRTAHRAVERERRAAAIRSLRERHLALCKELALVYWSEGDLAGAVKAFCDQMERREDTKVSGWLLALAAIHIEQQDAGGLKLWIEGFR